MLLPVLSFSQSKQIELVLKSGDTLALVPIKNIRNANIKFVERQSLQNLVIELEKLIANQDNQLRNYSLQVDGLEYNIILKNAEIKKYKDFQALSEEERESLLKDIKKLKRGKFLVIIGAISLVIVCLI